MIILLSQILETPLLSQILETPQLANLMQRMNKRTANRDGMDKLINLNISLKTPEEHDSAKFCPATSIQEAA